MKETEINYFAERLLDLMSEYVEDQKYNVSPPREQIIVILAEMCVKENKLSRHAIAEALSASAISPDTLDTDSCRWNHTKVLVEADAYKIALGTRTC